MIYAGIVTRGVALVIDALIVNLFVIIAGAAVNLLVSLFGGNINFDAAGALAAGFLWFVWLGLYFAIFWNVTGQTPGDRVMGIRVVGARGGELGLWRSVVRFIGLVLCALPLGLGFVPVLYDSRRRGLHDRLARTVVQWVDAPAQDQQLLTPGAVSAPGVPPQPGS
jgi:uncharacterized RDD family membrane protein YckC